MSYKRVNVCICDTDANNCAFVADAMKHCMSWGTMEIWIDCFQTGKAFMEAMKTMDYDIAFIETKLEDMKGLELGRYIREECGDQQMQIVYMSASGFYAMELFETRPIHFLVKPIDQKTIGETLIGAMKHLKREEGVFSYVKGRVTHWEDIQNIVCFESYNRQLKMHTLQKSVMFYGKLKDVHHRLKDFGFVYAHQSYLVNRRYIEAFDGHCLQMKNGMKVEVSQKRKKEVSFSLKQFMI